MEGKKETQASREAGGPKDHSITLFFSLGKKSSIKNIKTVSQVLTFNLRQPQQRGDYSSKAVGPAAAASKLT